MTTESPAREAGEEPLEALYAQMLRIRRFEDMVYRLFMQNEIQGSIHLYNGQEAVAVGVCSTLGADDVVAATYRGHGVCLARHTPPHELLAELLGRRTGVCGGRAGSMNVVDLRHGVLGCFSIVGGSIAAATGAGLAAQLSGKPVIAAAFFGDGAVNQAYFHECLNFAGVRGLPIVYVCENNQYGEFTPWRSVTAGGTLVSRPSAYGITAVEVDGNDVIAVRDAAQSAVVAARGGHGPQFLVCETYRQKGHSRHDDPSRYRPSAETEDWLQRDPLRLAEGRLNPNAIGALRAEIERELDDALALARSGQAPDPGDMASATKELAWK